MAPDDLITTYNLAQALLELDPDEHRNEADRLLLRVIEVRGSIARRDLRAEQPEGLRQDAMSACLQALQLFEGMEQQRFMAVLTGGAAAAAPAPGHPAGGWSARERIERKARPLLDNRPLLDSEERQILPEVICTAPSSLRQGRPCRLFWEPFGRLSKRAGRTIDQWPKLKPLSKNSSARSSEASCRNPSTGVRAAKASQAGESGPMQTE